MSILHECKTFIFIFCFSFCVFSLLFFSFACGCLLPSSFSQPACRCLQTTWRLTVICSRFPKPTIWAKKKLTGLRSHVPARDTTAAATHRGEAGMVSNTPIMITMSLLRRTCGLRMSTATEGDTPRPVITGIMEARVVIPPHLVIQMSRGHQGHPRGTLKTPQCVTTLQDDPRLQEGEPTLGPEGTTLRTTPEIHLGTTMASAPPDKGTHTVPHAASPSHQWTCKVNPQVNQEIEQNSVSSAPTLHLCFQFRR